MHNVSDVATDPASVRTNRTGPPGALYTNAGDPAKINAVGARDGVPIRVGTEPMGRGIITGFPDTGSPGRAWTTFQSAYHGVGDGGYSAISPEGATSYDSQPDR
jgi:hypothetical protein